LGGINEKERIGEQVSAVLIRNGKIRKIINEKSVLQKFRERF
jgi:hypothetical protein